MALKLFRIVAAPIVQAGDEHIIGRSVHQFQKPIGRNYVAMIIIEHGADRVNQALAHGVGCG